MPTSPLPPAGWYPNPDNAAELRWWDGKAWSAHTAAPGTVTQAPATTAAKAPRRIPISTWVGVALAVIFGLSAMSTGIGGFLVYGLTALRLVTFARSAAD